MNGGKVDRKSDEKPLRWVLLIGLAACIAVFVSMGLWLAEADASTIEGIHDVGAEGQPALEHGVTNVGGGNQVLGFWKDPAGIVHLVGVFHAPSETASLFTLPTGYRPTEVEHLSCYGSDKLHDCYVEPDGKVSVYEASGAVGSISGITFRSAEGSSTWPEGTGGGEKGAEGKEGKEGKEGPAGPEGKEGPAGPEGAGGTSGKVEVKEFGAKAESTFSELDEHIELLMWCLIGTVIAGLIFFGTRDLLRIKE